MLKHVKRMSKSSCSDNRTVDQKVADLKNIGLNVSVRASNDKYKDGYILGKVKNKQCMPV